MRNIIRSCVVIICSLFVVTNIYATTKVNEQSLDGIVAVVNDTPITQTELNDAVTVAKKQMESSGTPAPSEAVLQKQILQQLIDRKLQLQLAEQSGIKVTDEQIDSAIHHIAEENKMTKEQLFAQVKNQGLSVADYRKELREEIMIQQVQQHEVGAKINITPQEVNDFMHSKSWQASNNKEYHVEDIVIALPDSPTSQQIQDAKKRAETVLDKINHGTSFRAAAAAESSGNKALQGGDLGWRKLPEIPTAFADHVIHMEANGIAGPIQTPNGFHIIHLVGVRDTEKQNAVTHAQIERLIYQRKMEEQLQTWMAKIRSQAYINTSPED